MSAMCLDLTSKNKFLIAWGVFLTIILPIHVILLAVYCVASFFTKDKQELD
jgi:hypothetical protein